MSERAYQAQPEKGPLVADGFSRQDYRFWISGLLNWTNDPTRIASCRKADPSPPVEIVPNEAEKLFRINKSIQKRG
jgi:hypothetical protein